MNQYSSKHKELWKTYCFIWFSPCILPLGEVWNIQLIVRRSNFGSRVNMIFFGYPSAIICRVHIRHSAEEYGGWFPWCVCRPAGICWSCRTLLMPIAHGDRRHDIPRRVCQVRRQAKANTNNNKWEHNALERNTIKMHNFRNEFSLYSRWSAWRHRGLRIVRGFRSHITTREWSNKQNR